MKKFGLQNQWRLASMVVSFATNRRVSKFGQGLGTIIIHVQVEIQVCFNQVYKLKFKFVSSFLLFKISLNSFSGVLGSYMHIIM